MILFVQTCYWLVLIGLCHFVDCNHWHGGRHSWSHPEDLRAAHGEPECYYSLYSRYCKLLTVSENRFVSCKHAFLDLSYLWISKDEFYSQAWYKFFSLFLLISVQEIAISSIVCSTKQHYISYSEADFEVFRLAGSTCWWWGEIWHGGVDRRSTHPCQSSPHRCNDKGIGPPKVKFLLRFCQNLEYKSPTGVYPSRDFPIFTKFADFVPHFRIC